MPEKDEQNKVPSKVSMKIGDVEVQFEGTTENIKKLMNKEMVEFAKNLGDGAKESLSSPANVLKTVPKIPEEVPKAQNVLPPTAVSTTSKTPTKDLGFKLNKNTEKSDKKGINWKNMVIALVVACIVLLASVIGVIAYY